jgi:hypothetical protein
MMTSVDGSDVLAVQKNNAPSGGSQNVVVRGYSIDQGGYIGGASSGLAVTNTRVGEFTGNH